MYAKVITCHGGLLNVSSGGGVHIVGSHRLTVRSQPHKFCMKNMRLHPKTLLFGHLDHHATGVARMAAIFHSLRGAGGRSLWDRGP